MNTSLTAPLAVSGQALTLGAGGITNNNTTASRAVTLSMPLVIGAAQRWYTANDANAVTILDGGLAGSGTITLAGIYQSNNANKPMIRLGGDNSGYTGTINTPGADSYGLLLFSPAAQTRGLIDLNDGNRNLWLTGNDASTPYTFRTGNTTPGVGEPMNVNFRNAGTSGLYFTGGSVCWDPGNGGDYTWLSGTHGQIRINGSDATSGQMLYFGNSSSSLILPGDRGLYDGGGGNNSALVTLRFALADDSAGQRTFTSSARLLILTRPAVNDANPGKTVLSGGSTAITSMDQIFDGNLSLSGGVLILDGVPWSTFTTDRSGGYNTTTDNAWQIPKSSGGFAARNGTLTIDGTGTTTATFNRSFTLGSSARGTDGLLYADSPVVISQGIAMTGDNQVTLRGGNVENNAGPWTVSGPVHEISGPITETGGARILDLRGNGTTAGGTIRLSNTGNTFSGGLKINPPGGAGGLIAIFPDDACLGLGSAITVGSGKQGQAGLLLFENQGAGAKTFSRNFEVAMGGDASSGDSGFGSWAGTVRYTATNTVTGNRTTLSAHVQSGRFEFGPTGRIVNNSTGGTQTYNKGGAGTLVISNSTLYAGSAQSLRWVLHEGTLETWQASVVTNGPVAFDVKGMLVGGYGANIQTAGKYERTWAIRGQDHLYKLSGGGHYGTKFWLDVATERTLAFDLGTAEMVTAEIFGSGAGTRSGIADGMIKTGAGTWTYVSRKSSAGGSGNFAMAVRVQQGVFDVTGPMGRGGLWLDGGTILAGTNSPFTVGDGVNRLRVDPAGGKLGISATALNDITRGAAFDGVDSTWNLGGTGTITLASRNDLNLTFSATTFPDINAGETVLIERDGTGTGVVQINDTAWSIGGRIGGTGGLKLGSGGTGALTVDGGLKVHLTSDAQGPLTVDGSVTLSNAAVDVTKADGYSPTTRQWVILEADSVSGSIGTVTTGYAATQTATQVILRKTGTVMLLR